MFSLFCKSCRSVVPCFLYSHLPIIVHERFRESLKSLAFPDPNHFEKVNRGRGEETQPVLPSPDGLGEGRSARALGGTAHLSDVAFPPPIILHTAFQTMKVRQSSACSLPNCTWFGRLCQVRSSDRVLSSCLRFHPPLVGAGETGPTLLASLARSLA